MSNVTITSILVCLALLSVDSQATDTVSPATEIVVPKLEDIPESRIDRYYDPATVPQLSRESVARSISSLSQTERKPHPYAEAVM